MFVAVGEFDHIVAAFEASPLTAVFKEMAITNDFSRLDKTAGTRHHFVPQLLLRRFSHAHKGKPFIFQMETSSRKAPTRVGLRSAAVRSGLYAAADEDGKRSNRNEGYLALVESHAAPALTCLLDDPASVTPGERFTIAFFVALQTMRTPAAAKQITTVANAAFKSMASEFYSDRRAFVDQYRERFGKGASDDEIEQFRQEVISRIRAERVRLSGEGGAAFSTGLTHAVDNIPMLFEFDWTLLRAPGGGFVTSDRGYAIHDPTPPYPWSWQAFLSSENTETTVPLSDTACLVMRPLPMGGGLTVREASAPEVETINLRTFGWAERYVFARTQEALVSVRKAARQRPNDVVRPKPLCQLILLEPDPDDDSLAERNRRLGWPPQLRTSAGDVRDYVVIPSDKPHPELWELVDGLTERRGRKRAGVGPDERVDARITNEPLHPLDVIPP